MRIGTRKSNHHGASIFGVAVSAITRASSDSTHAAHGVVDGWLKRASATRAYNCPSWLGDGNTHDKEICSLCCPTSFGLVRNASSCWF